MTSGAICGGGMPYVWATEAAPERWCFGERKRRPGKFVLRADWEQGTVPVEPAGWYEPIWVYECDGCGKDERAGFGGYFEAVGAWG